MTRYFDAELVQVLSQAASTLNQALTAAQQAHREKAFIEIKAIQKRLRDLAVEVMDNQKEGK